MIKCAFIGSYQYDLNLYEKLQKEIKNVITMNSSVEFVFYRNSTEFYRLCFWAVKKAKQQFPNKNITISLISRNSEQNTYVGIHNHFPDSWAFDKIIPVNESKNNKIRYSCDIWNKIERKMVQESNYIIAYCYPDLHDTDYNLYKYALNRPNVTIINLTNKETACFIKQNIKLQPLNMQYILEQINSGCTYSSLAKSLGVTNYLIKSQDNKGRRQLRIKMNQLRKALTIHNEIPTRACSVVSLIEPTNNSISIRSRFYNVLNSLINDLNVTSFMLEQDDLQLNMIYLTPVKKEIELTVVSYTHDKSEISIPEQWGFSRAKIINIDTDVKPIWAKRLASIKYMISHSDYVVCNLDENTTFDNRIRNYLKKQKNITVIDISKSAYISEQPLLL